MIISALLSSALAYVLWGFAHNLPLVFVFVVVFGGIVGPTSHNLAFSFSCITQSGGFSSIWQPAAMEIYSCDRISHSAGFSLIETIRRFTTFLALLVLRDCKGLLGRVWTVHRRIAASRSRQHDRGGPPRARGGWLGGIWIYV